MSCNGCNGSNAAMCSNNSNNGSSASIVLRIRDEPDPTHLVVVVQTKLVFFARNRHVAFCQRFPPYPSTYRLSSPRLFQACALAKWGLSIVFSDEDTAA